MLLILGAKRRPSWAFYILFGILAAILGYLAFSVTSDEPEISADRFRDLCTEGTVERVWIQGNEVKAWLRQPVPLEKDFTRGVRVILEKDISKDFDAIAALTEGVSAEAVEIVPPRDLTTPLILWIIVLSVIPVLYGAVWILNIFLRLRPHKQLSDLPGDQVARLIMDKKHAEAVRVGRVFLEQNPADTTVRINLATALLLTADAEGAREVHAGMDAAKLEGEMVKLYEKQRAEIEAKSKKPGA